MGIIVDEYGDICGLITMTDIVEEIIGQYNCEASSMQYLVRKVAEHAYEVNAGINIRDFNRATGYDLPVEGPNTIRGLLIEHLEYLPEHPVGVKLASYGLEVKTFKENQIETVKVINLESK